MLLSGKHLAIARRRVACVVASFCVMVAGVGAQELPTLPSGASAEETISAIEAEGRAFPTQPAVRSATLFEVETYTGTVERECVRISGSGPVRSGEFLIGGQVGGARAPSSARLSKIWWAPLHNSQDMELLVRGRRVDSTDATLQFTKKRPAYTNEPGHQEITTWFFPSSFPFPSPGTWAVVATSGSNWGCFVLSVR